MTIKSWMWKWIGMGVLAVLYIIAVVFWSALLFLPDYMCYILVALGAAIYFNAEGITEGWTMYVHDLAWHGKKGYLPEIIYHIYRLQEGLGIGIMLTAVALLGKLVRVEYILVVVCIAPMQSIYQYRMKHRKHYPER